MDIQNARYGKGDKVILAVKDSQSVAIPVNPDNTDYQEIMRQVEEEGLVIAPFVE